MSVVRGELSVVAARPRAIAFALLAFALTGCPVDERTLYTTPTVIVGYAGDGGEAGESGAGGADGGAAGSVSAGGTDSGGSSGGAGKDGGGGQGGTSAGASGGVAGSAAGNGSCGCAGTGGTNSRCPDTDNNHVPDCDETLAKNPSFDRDVLGWSAETGLALSWSESDAHALEGSGALGVESTVVQEQEGSLIAGAHQCFGVQGGKAISVAVEVSIPNAAGAARAGINLIPYDSPACSGTPVGNVNSTLLTGADWKPVSVTHLTSFAAKSVLVRLAIVKPFDHPRARVFFDNVLVKLN